MPLLPSSKPREQVCFAFQHPFWAGSKTACLQDMFRGDVRVWDVTQQGNGSFGPDHSHLLPLLSSFPSQHPLLTAL